MKPTTRILTLLLAILVLSCCFAACKDANSSGDKDLNPSNSKLVFKTKTADNADITIAVGADADVVVTSLGNSSSVNSSESCGGFEGKDYVYTYKGFRLSTTPAKNGQIVCKLELTDDSVKTPEGLYIGMSRSDAETAMKSFKAEAVGDNLTYSSEGVKLQVIFRDGAVTGIIYVAA